MSPLLAPHASQNAFKPKPSLLSLAMTVAFFAVNTPALASQPDVIEVRENSNKAQVINNTPLSQAMQQSQALNLAEHPSWRRLLYYPEPTQNANQHLQSRIINAFNSADNQKDFFVSPDGATNPKAEMDAMLLAMFDSHVPSQQSVQCRFPARTHWLKNTLGIQDSDLPKVDCQTFDNWMKKIDPQSASIIFAAEYLDSPASAFAHSFLRFDHDNPAPQYYFNYTPKVTEGENFVKFAYKSAIAGNAGVIDIVDYKTGIQQYKVAQGRDVWRYRLNLSTEQVQQLARQVYEIKDQTIRYRLLDENCASEILALLNALYPNKNFLVGMPFDVSPAQIVRRLSQENLIDSGHFEPAKVTKQQAQTNTANHNLNNDRPLPMIPSRNNPLLAPKLSRFDFGIASEKNNITSNALTFGYRSVYHDALDPQQGYPIGSQLTALGANFNVFLEGNRSHDRVELANATLIHMRSLNPINTARAKRSWGADVSLQQVQDGIKSDNNNHLVANLMYETGVSYAYGQPLLGSGEIPPNLCYALGSLSTQFGKGLYHGYRAGVGANLGCIHQFSSKLRGLAELSLPFWLSGDSDNERYWRPTVSIGTQYDLNSHQAIRLKASHQWTTQNGEDNKVESDTISFSYLRYFE